MMVPFDIPCSQGPMVLEAIVHGLARAQTPLQTHHSILSTTKHLLTSPVRNPHRGHWGAPRGGSQPPAVLVRSTGSYFITPGIVWIPAVGDLNRGNMLRGVCSVCGGWCVCVCVCAQLVRHVVAYFSRGWSWGGPVYEYLGHLIPPFHLENCALERWCSASTCLIEYIRNIHPPTPADLHCLCVYIMCR